MVGGPLGVMVVLEVGVVGELGDAVGPEETTIVTWVPWFCGDPAPGICWMTSP